MFYYKLIDNFNKVILSNLSEKENFLMDKCMTQSELIYFNREKCRQGKFKKYDIGEVFLLSSDINEVNSPRIFKSKLSLYVNFIEEIKNIKEEILETVLHDITNINAHCIQELYDLIPEYIIMGKTYDDQISKLEEHLTTNKKIISKSLFKIYRDINNLKAECTNLKYIYSNKLEIDKKSHDINSAIKPSLHVYMPSLRKKGVTINIDEKTSKNIYLNYEYFESALFPLLDNITKYTLQNSELLIYYGNTIDGFAITFDMISMAIKNDEKDKIFEKGYSGIYAKKNKINGKGIGMKKIKDSLFVNNAELRISINVNKKVEKKYKTTPYERNVFQVVFLDQNK